VGEGYRRFDDVELEVDRLEERGGSRERVDGGADIVPKTRQRELGRAGPAADRVTRFDDEDRASGLGQRDRGGEAVRPSADDDRV